MATVHALSRTDARRIAVRAQLLTKERPTELLETVRQLSLVQLNPTNAVAPSADLVLWSRLGSRYSAQELEDSVNEQALVEIPGQHRATGQGPCTLPSRDGRVAGRGQAARLQGISR